MRPFRLGLTGSIGMGKSTTAALFAEEGVPVWDADAAVHRLYSSGGALVAPVAALCPEAIRDGAVHRPILRDWIAADPAALPRLEALVHPAVAEDRAAFLAGSAADVVLLDIPLLFEKAYETDMDATLLVTAPPALQRARVLLRGTMTEAQFEAILARQMPDSEKRARATHIIETLGLEAARASVRALLAYIRETADA
ncbi:dephospho-CoA kinase [Rhodobacter sp. NSM]|uniref:dephospho-CoA kinase n=1 Tax=Rhodobacter sp. NSM TaxID=3457501 RepID=UPI003FD242ED